MKEETKKLKRIEIYFKKIMLELGLDLTDDSLIGTPKRVAKMYVKELFSGLIEPMPKMTVIENKFHYDQMLIESNITLNSCCEHHFIPIIGKAHVAYIPNQKVIGLSKINRLVDYYGRRPQVQERLTNQVHDKLKEVLECSSVAVVIDGVHTCVRARGIKDSSSVTRTSMLSGFFKESKEAREEFFASIPSLETFRL